LGANGHGAARTPVDGGGSISQVSATFRAGPGSVGRAWQSKGARRGGLARTIFAAGAVIGWLPNPMALLSHAAAG
jgi:hypothetical protein